MRRRAPIITSSLYPFLSLTPDISPHYTPIISQHFLLSRMEAVRFLGKEGNVPCLYIWLYYRANGAFSVLAF